jgi:UPF0755 protein
MKKKIILGILALIILVAVFFAWQLFGPTVRQPEKKYFFISTGENYEGVRASLDDQNIIGGGKMFDLASKIIGYEKVKPGRYEIKKGMSLVNLVRMLNNGQQSPVNFVITKIRTKEVLADRIGNSFECDSLQMINFLNNPDSLKEYGLDSNTVMAAAMPYTYTVKWNTTPGKIFQQFYAAYKNFWTEERKQQADSLGYTPLEVSTIASIIEEETNAKSDKPNIASVYMNRIEKGWPLQADPTLKFALKDFSIKRIRDKHKEIVSPYNTYKNKGLPPGPICTPSVETIDAVLNAPKTNYMFFVANSNFSGTHIFTSDLSDHNKYADLYQKELDKRQVK